MKSYKIIASCDVGGIARKTNIITDIEVSQNAIVHITIPDENMCIYYIIPDSVVVELYKPLTFKIAPWTSNLYYDPDDILLEKGETIAFCLTSSQ